MNADRSFCFGTRLPMAQSGKEWADLARRAEDLGYDSLHVDDHYPSQLATMPALMAAACATSTIRIGPLVAGVDYRNPVWFAKECATVDVLCDGRFTLGIGAGWMRRDYAITGIPLEPTSTRIERLDETITIMRGLWGDDRFGFDGSHFRVGEIDGFPKPATRIPILVGGGGHEVLSVAARRADIVGINPRLVPTRGPGAMFVGMTAQAVDERVELVRKVAGDRADAPELHLQFFVAAVTDEPDPVIDSVAELYLLTPSEVRSSPYFQIGPLGQITEKVMEIRERWGITSLLIPGSATVDFAPMVADLSSAS